MADKATAALIKGLIDQNAIDNKAAIDANAVKLKAQVDALLFNPDPPPVVAAPKISYPVPLSFTVGKSIGVLSPVNSGGPAVFSGALPDGLSLDVNTGDISGTPKTASSLSNYTITAKNASGSSAAIIPMSVNAPPVVIPSNNPGGAPSSPQTLKGVSGTIIGGLTFDGKGAAVDLLVLDGCKGVHLTMLKFINTTGYAVRLINCQDITFDFNFWNMVNFGLHAENCTGTKVNNNQGLNLNGPDPVYDKNFAHWIQFHACSGGGQQVNNNRLENVAGVAIRPHDAISIDASSGISGNPIQINGNWIRGGQKTGFPSDRDTGGGIMAPDESGNYYEVKNNIMVNPGCSGIQANGTGSNILLDGNQIFNNQANPNSGNGITILGSHSAMVVQNNRVWWLNRNNKAVAQSDGETGLWMGGKMTAAGVTFNNNNWLDTSLNEKILPDQIITYK